MRVFVTGATGVLGGAAARALLADGHEVTGLARCPDKARRLEAGGIRPVIARLFDVAALTEALRGMDAVCNLATHIPVGRAAIRPGAWRGNDRIRSEGSKAVATAARAAGVRRLVQESVSFLYADGADAWIDERSALSVTRAVEPSAVAEANAAEFGSPAAVSVILRFGNLVGNDPMTRWMTARARAGHAIGLGPPQSWAHLVHPQDAGSAVASALMAPAGVYNVGADPVRRADMWDVLARAAGGAAARRVPTLLVKVAGDRIEPLTRSHRISSVKFQGVTGWKPDHDLFDESWLAAANPAAGSEHPPSGDQPAADRRRRLDEVFGDVLPALTGDERDSERGDTSRDEEFRRDVPPHHG